MRTADPEADPAAEPAAKPAAEPGVFEKMKNIADEAKKFLTPTKPHKYQIPGSDNYFEIIDNKKQDNNTNDDDELKKSKASSFIHNNLFDPIKADLNEKQLCIKTISSTINESSYFNNNNNSNNNQKENIKDYFNNLDKCAKGNKMAFYV